MKKVSLNFVMNTYEKLKRLAYNARRKNDFDSVFRFISAAADIAYSFNWIYVDFDLENTLEEIADEILAKTTFNSKKNRIVFHDAFAIKNKGLSQQYMRALLHSGAEILFIYEETNIYETNSILEELQLYDQVELFSVGLKLSAVEKLILYYEKIIDFQPEKAFLHLKPSSALAVCLWSALPQCTRYFINLTDHAFWLGKCCIDFSLEFRNYGYTVSLEKRGLLPEQLLVLPFYPVTDCSPFSGFPLKLSNESIVILTGGAFYKMYGGGGVFFIILKKLLLIHPKVVILIAGSGNEKPFNDFIFKNNFEDRLFLIGERRDINYVMAQCDIFLNTYPFGGGLMVQLAAIYGKPILSYSSTEIRNNFIEGLLNSNGSDTLNVTHTTFHSFFQDAERLINDKYLRFKRGESLKRHIISVDEFNSRFISLINSNQNEMSPELENINYNILPLRYLEVENNYNSMFYVLIIAHLRFSALLYFPTIVFRSFFTSNLVLIVADKILTRKQ